MKAKWLIVMALGLQTWTSVSSAAGISTSATMEVGLRIVETCAIHAGDSNGAQGAQVDCAHGSPYLVSSPAPSQTSTPAPVTERHEATESAPALVTVAF